MKVVIIGGVAGGATAAARLRRIDERAQITIFEKSGYISYANCGLPYYIGGEIKDKNQLTLQTPESFGARFNVEVKVLHEVKAINTERKSVTVTNLKTLNTFEEPYDKLIISTGAKPLIPSFEGADNPNVFTLRTVEDTFRIKNYITQNRPKTAVVVGGGFIGIEMAENLTAQGIKVTLVEAAPQLMAPFDGDMAAFIHAEMLKNGVDIMLGASVEGFSAHDGGLKVLLKGEPAQICDFAILAIGVVPDTALAKDAGAELGIKGSIVVNEYMQTSLPDIYAVGDAVQIKNFVTREPALISLAGPANKQGRVAADNICGLKSKYTGGQGSSVIKVFGITAACTGINERVAAACGIEVDKVILSPLNHAGYYPGGEVMTMKVLFEKQTYKLLGAQIIGGSGVDKRIDVLAMALRAGMKVTDLTEADLAYAPPYSSAKDPVNMAGFVAENIKNGLVKQWYYEQESTLARDGSVTLLDTRTKEEYERGHMSGFKNIPVDELRARINEVPKNKPVYVVCQSGLRSYIASRILSGNGIESYNFAGGYRFYAVVKNFAAPARKAMPCGKEG